MIRLGDVQLPGGGVSTLWDLGGGGRLSVITHADGSQTRWAIQPGDAGLDQASQLVDAEIDHDAAVQRELEPAARLSSWDGLLEGLTAAPVGSARLFVFSAECERRLLAEMEGAE